MAEFRLTDNYEKAKRAEKTPIPKTTVKNYVEAPKEDEQTVYQVVEEMPEFPGGMPALMEFIRKNLRHDKAEKNERVIIQIVVDKKGNATNPVVLRSTNPALDEEALRIVSLMPKWKPADKPGRTGTYSLFFLLHLNLLCRIRIKLSVNNEQKQIFSLFFLMGHSGSKWIAGRLYGNPSSVEYIN